MLELYLRDQSGLQTLVELVPIASRPQVVVIILTLMTRDVWLEGFCENRGLFSVRRFAHHFKVRILF